MFICFLNWAALIRVYPGLQLKPVLGALLCQVSTPPLLVNEVGGGKEECLGEGNVQGLEAVTIYQLAQQYSAL